ncbi:MAG: xylan 1,4-beta-xylosidase [Firmicutes bacterium]|nr:xylan 1,4-beta-xylosidase [Bacillota bacterium]MBQ9605093.1 xylan 1,4-beta-xylosidase [Bacillota bacterium]
MDRFEVIYRENTPMGKIQIKILVDKETGVNYLMTSDDHGTGITPLLNSEGKPVTTK